MGLAVQNERITIPVGAITLVVVIAAAAFSLLVDDCYWRRGYEATVYFEHTSLVEGSEVQVAGRVVGTVTNVGLVPASRVGPDHPLAHTGGVAVRVRIERRYRHMLPYNGEYFHNSKGIIGKPYLEVGPPPGNGPWERTLAGGDVIRGIDPPRLDRVLQRSYDNLIATSLFLDTVRPEGKRLWREADRLAVTLGLIEPAPGAFAATGDSIDSFTTEVSAVRERWSQGDVSLADIEAVAARGRDVLDKADAAFARIDRKLDLLTREIDRMGEQIPDDLQQRFTRVADTARAHIAKVRHTMATVREMIDMVDRGEGTIGALMNDPEFADDAKEIGKYVKRHPWVFIGIPQD